MAVLKTREPLTRVIAPSGVFSSRRLFGRVVAAILFACSFFLSFPDYGFPFLAWIAFVPLLLAIDGEDARTGFLTGLIGGFLAYTAVFFWIYEVDSFRPRHGILLGAYLGFYTAVWCGILALFQSNKAVFSLLGAAAWVVMDYLLANAGFLAFSWATLARTQHTNLPLVQLAGYTGEYGVTFLVMLVNISIAQAVSTGRWQRLVIVGLVLASFYIWGLTRLDGKTVSPIMRVAAIQPALERRAPGTGSGHDESLAILERLSLEAASQGAELLVWPEAVVNDWRSYPGVLDRITDVAKNTGIPLLIGVSESEKFVYRTGTARLPKPERHNSAILIMPDGRLTSAYNKNLLVPFAEYTPLEGQINWPEWLVSEIVPMSPGDGYRRFTLSNGVTISPIICWENLFADFVRLAAPQGPGMLIHLVNDNWFGRSPASAQHNTASVFRAVENGLSVIVASNTGPSVIIDNRGRAHGAVEALFKPGIAIADIAVGRGTTFYSRYGEIFTFTLTLMLFVALVRQLVGKG